MIIYIHGFGGSGEGMKAKAFREYFKTQKECFIAPSLSYVPDLAINTLEELIQSFNEDVTLIGSSLGGFYTIYLAQKYNLRGVLLNPSIYPYITLKNYVGYAPSFYDESNFLWTQTHIGMLKAYEQKVLNQNNFMLLVQKGDELLDAQEAINKLPEAYSIIEDGGSHGFDGIEQHFESIKEFLLKENNGS